MMIFLKQLGRYSIPFETESMEIALPARFARESSHFSSMPQKKNPDMSNFQKNLLLIMILPLSLLLIGLIAAWGFLGADLWTWLGLLVRPLACVFSLFVLVGLLSGLHAFRVHSRYPNGNVTHVGRPLDRRGILLSFGLIIGLCFLFYLIQYLGSGESTEFAVKTSGLFIAGGGGLSILFGTMFLATIIARMLYRRGRRYE